jgi:hypothetical protein
LKKYQWVEPTDAFTALYRPFEYEEDEIMDWKGYTPTGCTASFKSGLGPRQRVENTFNSFYSMPDYYMMCAMRFDKWFRCDSTYGDDRERLYDHALQSTRANLKDSEHYPCFREFYEVRYACADNVFDMLVELAYRKKARNYWREKYSNVEARSFPTTFDSPHAPETTTYTY